MYHNPANFTEPEVFAPDRWLGATYFSRDKSAAFEPFSTGKRSCIGQKYVKAYNNYDTGNYLESLNSLTEYNQNSLAHSEMRQIMARLLWKYDIELVDREWHNKPWHDQNVHATYVKPPLNVRLTLRPEKHNFD